MPLWYLASIKGDHRLLGIDLDPNVLFGNVIAPPMQLLTHGVNSRQTQKVTKFCKGVMTQCNKCKLAERIAHLQTLQTLNDDNIKELDAIDETLTQICLNANQTCSLK